MSRLKTNKIFAFIALAIELAVLFVLFGKIRNLELSNQIEGSYNAIYILIIVAVVFALIIFILLISNKVSTDDIYSGKLTQIDEAKSKDRSSKIETEEETSNMEYYLNKILPKENAKLDLVKYTEKILNNIAKEFDIVQGLFFVKEKKTGMFNIAGKYAYFGEEQPKSFKSGETLSGQVAKNKTTLNLKEIPEDYVTILSGLGSSSPNNLLLIPIILNDETVGVIELASFKKFGKIIIELFESISDKIGKELIKL
ncbi:MAG: GAF domain-containing protein [Bacteroidales bacterium]|nr:GAF domain-containing protein [Bacteroidales bacterium]